MPTVEQRYDEAIELQQQGKLEEAVGKLSALIADQPDYALGHAALSVFYGKLGRHDEAVEHAQKVCELEPDDSFSFHGDESDLSARRPASRGRAGPRAGDAEAVGRPTRNVDTRWRPVAVGCPNLRMVHFMLPFAAFLGKQAHRLQAIVKHQIDSRNQIGPKDSLRPRIYTVSWSTTGMPPLWKKSRRSQ